MSNYTKTVDFAAKDTLPSGDSGKIIKGTEFETEFDNISTAIATKADSAAPTFTGTSVFTNLDINGTVQADGAVTVGVDDTGYDVKFFGATTGKSLLWDESADSLIVTGTTTLVGTTNLDAVDVDGDMTFGDNNKAIFGAGSDLQIYHTGTYSLIADTSGTGPLRVVTNTFQLNNAADTQNMINAAEGGAVNLYHAGNAKLATTATGIDVTGTVTADGLTVDGDLAVSAANSRIRLFETDTTDLNTQLQNQAGDFNISRLDDDASASTLQFKIDHATGNVSIPNGDLDVTGTVTADGLTVESGVADIRAGNIGPANNASVNIGRADTSIASGNPLGYVQFLGSDNTAGSLTPHAYIGAIASSTHSAGSNPTEIVFGTTATSSETILERLKISDNGDVSFYEDTGTTPKMVWDASAEKLGIGTSSPEKPLHVNSGTGNIGVRVESSDVTTSIEFMDSGTTSTELSARIGAKSDDFFVQTNGLERMRIDSSGNVGIGGTPTAPLHVFGGGILGASSTNPIAFTGSGGTNAGIGSYNANNDFNVYSAGTGNIKFVTGAVWSSAGVLTTVGSERMRIDSSGNVGIGTASPSTQLHVLKAGSDANVTIESTGTGFDARLNLYANSTGVSQIRFGDEADTNTGLLTYDHSGNSMQFRVNDSERMRIDASGLIQIGNAGSASSPTIQSLIDPDTGIFFGGADILGFSTGGAEAMRIDSSGNLLVGKTVTGSANAGFAFVNDQYLSATNTSAVSGSRVLLLNRQSAEGTAVDIRQANTTVGTISVTASATAYNTSSDQRLKENIADADDAGSKVDAIQVRKFDWKADGSHQDYGMVAQELLEVAPEAVSAPEDPEEMMGVDYSKLVPMMLKEIQSLRARVAQLES